MPSSLLFEVVVEPCANGIYARRGGRQKIPRQGILSDPDKLSDCIARRQAHNAAQCVCDFGCALLEAPSAIEWIGDSERPGTFEQLQQDIGCCMDITMSAENLAPLCPLGARQSENVEVLDAYRSFTGLRHVRQ